MAGFFARIQAYKFGGDVFEEPYRGINGGIAVASVLLFTSKHSWELWGANFNYMALTCPKKNVLGRILIDSVLMHYKENITIAVGERGQKEFYGLRKWEKDSSAEIGKAAHKAIMLLGYILAPIHRNVSREGSAAINNYLIRERNIG